MGCSDEHFDTECRTMEGIQVTWGAEPDNNEKIIEICGKRLGQCHPHFTSTNHIEMRMCCLDCDFTNSTMKLQKEINPKDDRRQMRQGRSWYFCGLPTFSFYWICRAHEFLYQTK